MPRARAALVLATGLVVGALDVALIATWAQRTPPTTPIRSGATASSLVRPNNPSCGTPRPGTDAHCGAGASASCCAALRVPGGSFRRSYDGRTCRDGANEATVGDFTLDAFEVTVGRFRAFLAAGGATSQNPPRPGVGAHPKIAGSGWDPAWNASLVESPEALGHRLVCHRPFGTWTEQPEENERHPVSCLTWYEAFAFCAWDGGRLPTDAERNYVAAGGAEQRVLPWSVPPSAPDIAARHAVFGAKRPEAVGSRSPDGDGRWGHADLAGNVWEWTLDGGDPAALLPTVGADFCGAKGYPLPCVDCADRRVTSARVLRGGGFGMPGPGMITSIRRADPPSARQSVFGVRCARDTGGAAESAGPAASARACVPRCGGRACGPDACGGECGACAEGSVCDDSGACRAIAYPRGAQRLVEGAVFPGFHVSGFPRGGGADGDVRDMSAADFYEPGGEGVFGPRSPYGEGKAKPRKLLVVFAKAWSDISRDDARRLAEAHARILQARGEVWLLLLEGDRPGQPADIPNLDQWVRRHSVAYPSAVDSALLFGQIATSAPSAALVDTTTMIIERISTGPLDEPRSALALLLEAN